jgi:hypothetical protein
MDQLFRIRLGSAREHVCICFVMIIQALQCRKSPFDSGLSHTPLGLVFSPLFFVLARKIHVEVVRYSAVKKLLNAHFPEY